MVWAPSMRVWAGEEVKVEEAELEEQVPMEDVEEERSTSGNGNGNSRGNEEMEIEKDGVKPNGGLNVEG